MNYILYMLPQSMPRTRRLFGLLISHTPSDKDWGVLDYVELKATHSFKNCQAVIVGEDSANNASLSASSWDKLDTKVCKHIAKMYGVTVKGKEEPPRKIKAETCEFIMYEN